MCSGARGVPPAQLVLSRDDETESNPTGLHAQRASEAPLRLPA